MGMFAAMQFCLLTPAHAESPGNGVLPGAATCVALGDSLTFAYEAAFGFRLQVPSFGSIGDGFGPEVRNWMEILRDPAYRGDHFDFGAREMYRISIPDGDEEDVLFRHQYNWALPGLRIGELRGFLEGTLTFDDLLSVNALLGPLVSLSDLDKTTAFELADLEEQIRHTANRLVFFIGGNDVRTVYRSIYRGNSPAAFIEAFAADAEAILDILLALNPELPVVVVSVPHIGITPDIKSSFPTTPVGTGRVTAALSELNRRLKSLADARGYGFADIFTPTLPMLAEAPFSIQGIPFANSGSNTGDLGFVWLNGGLSANFHPNTNGQAVIANEIIDAFNTRYDAGIAPLTATEILGGLLGKSPSEIDMTFEAWMASYGLAGLGPEDDSDGDGLPAIVEFALGLNPLLHDSRKVSYRLRATESGRRLELSYPLRLPSSARFHLAATFTTDLNTPFAPILPPPPPGPDGLFRVSISLENHPRAFLRLEAEQMP